MQTPQQRMFEVFCIIIEVINGGGTTWQRKKQNSSVIVVAMKHLSGWDDAQAVVNGTR